MPSSCAIGMLDCLSEDPDDFGLCNATDTSLHPLWMLFLLPSREAGPNLACEPSETSSEEARLRVTLGESSAKMCLGELWMERDDDPRRILGDIW
eukprot:CAMPEP_0115086868 /NCGR_PEP_ID=MMETSP0227-20121206/22870_1 /TAXON_ID=89957 /ORGANISM="Polarella glacialis, Strain CCMP 1383" /LENGTH=94 /DNA_ID=CAMNT_0002476465 /DNA_START=1418 /DNA_END=1699 /DNA_ORIENTATION=+